MAPSDVSRQEPFTSARPAAQSTLQLVGALALATACMGYVQKEHAVIALDTDLFFKPV